MHVAPVKRILLQLALAVRQDFQQHAAFFCAEYRKEGVPKTKFQQGVNLHRFVIEPVSRFSWEAKHRRSSWMPRCMSLGMRGRGWRSSHREV